MRRTIWIALFILALVASSDAQSPAVAICPTLIVTGPAGVNVPGDTMTFVADLSGEVPKSIA